MNNRRFNLRNVGLAVLLVFVVFGFTSSIVLIPFLDSKRPNNGGFTREIIYVKGEEGGHPGYFVIMDEINAKKGIPVDMLLHGLGTLNVSGNNCTWTTNGVSLLAMVAYPESINITSHMGYYAQIKDFIPYVKIRPPLNTKRMITLLVPYNATVPIPAIDTSFVDGAFKIQLNSNETWYFPTSGDFTAPNVSFSGDYLYYQQYPNGSIERSFGNDARSFSYNGTQYLFSTEAITSAYSNDQPVMATLRDDQVIPTYPSWQLKNSDILPKITGLDHPRLYFNDSFKLTLVDRCTNSYPWKTWYVNTRGQLPSSFPIDPSSYSQGARPTRAVNLAFIGYIEDNMTFINASRDILLVMDEVEDYRQHLERSSAISDYAFAYDLIHDHISTSDRDQIEALLTSHTQPMYEDIDTMSANNWRVVCSDGLAMAGIVLENADYVREADEKLDWYLQRERTRSEGGSFEAQSYMAYTWIHGLRVAHVLKNFGIRDYFTDPRLINTFNFSINCITPNKFYPLFEDCSYGNSWKEIYNEVGSTLDDLGYSTLASNMKWITGSYVINSPSYTIRRIIFHDHNISAVQPVIPTHNSSIFLDEGLACFRSGLGSKDTFLAISCKEYKQSHVHLDENSFELFALGEKLLTNPGYPGWDGPYHKNWTIITEASNTYLFNGSDQVQEVASGIQEWVLTEDLNYVSCDGSYLYSEEGQAGAELNLWLYFGLLSSLGVVVVVAVYKKWKKR
ncbi:MAG: heparinase II/III family protein [Candidatus Hodarchaeota archaeon]